MGRRAEVLEEAAEEAEQAALWYAERSRSASVGFWEELDKAFEAIAASPQAWPPHSHGTRRYVLRRYPFGVIYRLEPGRVVIVAIAHTSREPGYWSRRI